MIYSSAKKVFIGWDLVLIKIFPPSAPLLQIVLLALPRTLKTMPATFRNSETPEIMTLNVILIYLIVATILHMIQKKCSFNSLGMILYPTPGSCRDKFI